MDRKTKFGLKKRWNKYILVLILLLGMGFGYAYLNSNLNINGTSQISGNRWDIHWENPVVSEGSVTNTLPTIDVSRTQATYSVTLNNPGDFYEFTIDAVNGGTINGKVSLKNVEVYEGSTKLDSLPNYLSYSTTYADGREIAIDDTLNAGITNKYKIRVEFKRDINPEDLPDSQKSFNFITDVTYVQGNSTSPGECEFDGDMIKGAEFEKGIYTYHYKQAAGDPGSYSFADHWSDLSEDGWGVVLSATKSDATEFQEYIDEAPCKTINGKPVISYANMFDAPDKIRSIDFSNWDSSEVKYLNGMFSYSYSDLTDSYHAVKLIGLDKLDLSSAVDITFMFSKWYDYDNSFDVSDLANWDLSNVKSMQGMFVCHTDDNNRAYDIDGNPGRCSRDNMDYSDLYNWNLNSLIYRYNSCIFFNSYYPFTPPDWSRYSNFGSYYGCYGFITD